MSEMPESPDDIVGHKTFGTGPLTFRHEPLTRAEAEAILTAAKEAERKRRERMPDEQSAIQALFDAWVRLKEFGWNDPIFCPKDGTSFEVIEAGSTGVHRAHYQGEWPKGTWWVESEGDIYPSRPTLYLLLPEDEAKRKACMAEARAVFGRKRHKRSGPSLPSSLAREIGS